MCILFLFSVSTALPGSITLCPIPQNAHIAQEVDTFTQMKNNGYFQNKISPPLLFSAVDRLQNLKTGNMLLSCRLEKNPFSWLKIMGLFFACFLSA